MPNLLPAKKKKKKKKIKKWKCQQQHKVNKTD